MLSETIEPRKWTATNDCKAQDIKRLIEQDEPNYINKVRQQISLIDCMLVTSIKIFIQLSCSERRKKSKREKKIFFFTKNEKEEEKKPSR